jgi:hypothetical protein
LQSCHEPIGGVFVDASRDQQPTETRSVMGDSVTALVQSGDADGEDLTLPSRQRTAPVHQLTIQFQVLTHDGWIHGMDLDDVVGIIHAMLLRLGIRWDMINECHSRLPCWSAFSILAHVAGRIEY